MSISKVSLMKLQTDIRHWETSESFKKFTSRHNARTSLLAAITLERHNAAITTEQENKSNYDKTETKWSNKSLILKSIQKWNKLPSS